jgi:hypothetical protein
MRASGFYNAMIVGVVLLLSGVAVMTKGDDDANAAVRGSRAKQGFRILAEQFSPPLSLIEGHIGRSAHIGDLGIGNRVESVVRSCERRHV